MGKKRKYMNLLVHITLKTLKYRTMLAYTLNYSWATKRYFKEVLKHNVRTQDK